MFELNTKIIINSKMETFVFKLSANGGISYNLYDSSFKSLGYNDLNEREVKLYSVFIDTKDIIHLVALINSGELKYFKYMEDEWSKNTIANFNLKSNIYNQIEIFTDKDKLHIIYNYSNLINSNIWTIQHVIYDKVSEANHNCVRYISKKIPDPFFVDIDSLGSIHLLYRGNLNNYSQVYHIFYNPYTKVWTTVPKKISSDNINSSNPFLFIDSYDNIHLLLLEEINRIYKLKYLRMSSSGKEKYLWKEVKLPHIPISNHPLIVCEEDKKLKLIYIFNNAIECFSSTDYGNLWSKEDLKYDLNRNISMTKAISNLSFTNHRIRYAYSDSIDIPKLKLVNIYPNETISIELVEEPVEQIEIPKLVEDNPTIDTYALDEINDKIDEILDICKSYEDYLSTLITNQDNINIKLNQIQKTLDTDKPSFFSRILN